DKNAKVLQFAEACQHKRQAKKIPGSNLGGRERLCCQGGLPPQPLGRDWGVQNATDQRGYWGIGGCQSVAIL
ncbi:MAG: hypothetical protein CL547_11310, partial [Alcanivorax sp.]|nr:hypothetical protein [Alcanivorax sp.]